MVSQVSVMSWGPRIVDTVMNEHNQARNATLPTLRLTVKVIMTACWWWKNRLISGSAHSPRIEPLDRASHSWQQHKSYWVEKKTACSANWTGHLHSSSSPKWTVDPRAKGKTWLRSILGASRRNPDDFSSDSLDQRDDMWEKELIC